MELLQQVSTVAALVLTSSASVAKDIYEDYRSIATGNLSPLKNQ